MSHTKERKEKNCLNCGAEVQGRYCHICGQENLETTENLWGLITHFVYDITHFDGKFFTTLKYLLLRPGFLSKEFQRGRRASYLHPIKMYVFTSAVFFFVFFSIKKGDDLITGEEMKVPAYRSGLLKQLLTEKDSLVIKQLKDSLRQTDTVIVMLEEMKLIAPDPSITDSVRNAIRPSLKRATEKMRVFSWSGLPATLAQYDSILASQPKGKRDNWFRQYYSRKVIQLNAKFQFDRGKLIKEVLNKFLHSLPAMMFISLPFIAMFISLLYIRQKKTNFVHHAILSVHNYIAMYVLILLFMFASFVREKTGWWMAGFALFLLAMYMFYYNYKSLRNYFEQGRGKTILKFSILVLLTLVLFSILSTAFVINSLLAA